MPISISGDGTITGVSVGGLPDGIVDTDMLATSAVATAKIANDAVTVDKTGFTGDLQFSSGYGSAATAYGVRAFAVFDGASPGSPDITRNVSTIGDTATGRFTINFTNDMPDIHYAMAGSAGNHGTTGSVRGIMPDALFTTSAAAIRCAYAQSTAVDDDYISVMFVR